MGNAPDIRGSQVRSKNIVDVAQADGQIRVIAGGVIPQSDYQALYDAGCVAVFGPGTVIPKAALELLDVLADVKL